MSNLWFNIRFGSYHWQLDNRWRMSWTHNPVHDVRGPRFKWFAIYTWFGKHHWEDTVEES